MTRRSRVGTTGLLLRHLASDKLPSILLAVLVGLAVLVIAVLPRALSILSTAELRHELSSLNTLRTDVSASGVLGYQDLQGTATTAEDIFGFIDDIITRVPSLQSDPLGSAMKDPQWAAQLADFDATPAIQRVKIIRNVALGIDLHWQERVTFISGQAPRPWAGDDSDQRQPSERPPIEVAISSTAAKVMGLEVGDLLDYTPAPLLVSGIYDATNPDDAYWLRWPEFIQSPVLYTPNGPRASSSFYIDPFSAKGLGDGVAGAKLRVYYPTDVRSLDYSDAVPLQEQILKLETLGTDLENGEDLAYQSGLSASLTHVIEQVTSVTALLALAASAPLGVVFAVLALGVSTVIGRRRPALALSAARGAGELQLRGAMALEGALISLPISAVALVAAQLLLPVQTELASLAIAVLVALAVPVLFAATTSPRGLRAARADLGTRSRRRTRWIVEAIVVGLAALALYLIARRGLLTTTAEVGVDPLLASMPLLLSLGVCVIVLRLYPLPLLALQRRLRKRRGPVGMLGSARAVRDGTVGFASVLAIVVGVSAAVFSLVMATTVSTGLAVTAHEQVGADVRVEAPDLPADLLAKVAAVPGVARVAPIEIYPDSVLTVGVAEIHVTVAIADMASLREIRPEIPDLPTSKAAVPFLLSPDLAHRISDTATGLRLGDIPATYFAPLTAPLPALTTNYIVVDKSSEPLISGTAFDPSRLLIDLTPDADSAATSAQIRTLVTDAQRAEAKRLVQVLDATAVLHETSSMPSLMGLNLALLVAALASLALGVITIVIGSIAATGARNTLIGVLRLLGMSPRQVGGLVAWEVAPVAIAAVVAGTALGLVLPYIVTSVLDLRAFAGGTAALHPTIPWVLVGAVALGFALVILVAGLISVAIGRRADPARTVKMGAE